MYQALRTCEERQVEVDASGASFSFMGQGWRSLAKLKLCREKMQANFQTQTSRSEV